MNPLKLLQSFMPGGPVFDYSQMAQTRGAGSTSAGKAADNPAIQAFEAVGNVLGYSKDKVPNQNVIDVAKQLQEIGKSAVEKIMPKK
jgi:hypothetical protein